jgi:nucleotide-binding universal stress UspA family protein
VNKKKNAMSSEIRRILCATDLSGRCNHLYSFAIKLSRRRDASLMVIHVISQKSITAAKTLAYLFNETRKDIVKEKTDMVFKRMQEQLRALLVEEFKNYSEYANHIEHLLVYRGDVAEELVEKANRFGCEAIILGAPNGSFVKRLLRGDIVRKILRKTQKPVFLVSMKKGQMDVTAYDNSASDKEIQSFICNPVDAKEWEQDRKSG